MSPVDRAQPRNHGNTLRGIAASIQGPVAAPHAEAAAQAAEVVAEAVQDAFVAGQVGVPTVAKKAITMSYSLGTPVGNRVYLTHNPKISLLESPRINRDIFSGIIERRLQSRDAIIKLQEAIHDLGGDNPVHLDTLQEKVKAILGEAYTDNFVVRVYYTNRSNPSQNFIVSTKGVQPITVVPLKLDGRSYSVVVGVSLEEAVDTAIKPARLRPREALEPARLSNPTASKISFDQIRGLVAAYKLTDSKESVEALMDGLRSFTRLSEADLKNALVSGELLELLAVHHDLTITQEELSKLAELHQASLKEAIEHPHPTDKPHAKGK